MWKINNFRCSPFGNLSQEARFIFYLNGKYSRLLSLLLSSVLSSFHSHFKSILSFFYPFILPLIYPFISSFVALIRLSSIYSFMQSSILSLFSLFMISSFHSLFVHSIVHLFILLCFHSSFFLFFIRSFVYSFKFCVVIYWQPVLTFLLDNSDTFVQFYRIVVSFMTHTNVGSK